MSVRDLLRNPGRLLAKAASDPLETWTTVCDRWADRRERSRPQWNYESDSDWEAGVHRTLKAPWPCALTDEFRTLLPGIFDSLTAKGLKVGPESFGGWNDGDIGLVRAIYCLTRHLRPSNVVETGVAHGVTSRFILEALERNKQGHLWSIDLPPLDPKLQSEIGIAVDERCRKRWTLLKGSSRRHLPQLVRKIQKVDLFVHDSLHSERNVLFELGQVWPALQAGGAVVVDDIDANYAFHRCAERMPAFPSFVCDAEPVRPDLRRFNQKGMFGIVLKLDEHSGRG